MDVLIEVADVLVEHSLPHTIIETDADEDTIVLEVEYEKEEREVFREIEDIIAEHEEGGDDDDDNDDDADEDDENGDGENTDEEEDSRSSRRSRR